MATDRILARYTYVDISIAGKKVTEDLAPFLISFSFNDKTNGKVDDISLVLNNRDEIFFNEWLPDRGDIIECSIITENWQESGITNEYYCGKFEIDKIDKIDIQGLPSIINIQAVSSLNSNIRRQLFTKAWEKISLKAISQQVAAKHNYQLLFKIKDDIELSRCDQHEQSDLGFLSKLCKENGLMLKIYDDKLIIYEEVNLERQEISFIIGKVDMESYRFTTQTYDLYQLHFIGRC